MSSWWWFLSRSTGIVAAALSVVSLAWGFFFSSRTMGTKLKANWWLGLHKWLGEQKNLAVLRVRYSDIVANPAAEVARLNAFLGGRLNADAAVKAVDPSLYRNRKSPDNPATK